MGKKKERSHAMSKPGTYQIEVQGRIAPNFSARLIGPPQSL